ncbi:PHP domain-containing protein [Floccifex sp.]|uniref:PHP domain-containing protein n=1 Tax=Floccifex sp. TaxID=2815810 RepID=UPI002A753947|nr:PHP domain-containing protein [Floccifex sp.]MDY2959025.1 PHP domain-containing protein [Floccifex sp.]
MIYADLHVHTNYSDGTQTIEEVMSLAKEKGIKAVAITDHDTVFHWDQVKEISEQFGITPIRGVEMSCYDFDVYKKVHIVGLFLNDHPEHVNQLCQETLLKRDAYHHELIEELNKKGLDITYEDAKKFAPHNIVFKMHLFLAIVSKYPEYATKAKYRELFASKTTKETDMKMGYIEVQQGIQAILKDGGIPILAHPCEYDNYDEIEKYVGYGLKGIEISHSSMKEQDYVLTKQYAKNYNLLQSGGSDFHDKKLSIMGQHGLTKEQFEQLCKESHHEIKY